MVELTIYTVSFAVFWWCWKKKMQKPSIATGNSLVKRIECLLSEVPKLFQSTFNFYYQNVTSCYWWFLSFFQHHQNMVKDSTDPPPITKPMIFPVIIVICLKKQNIILKVFFFFEFVYGNLILLRDDTYKDNYFPLWPISTSSYLALRRHKTWTDHEHQPDRLNCKLTWWNETADGKTGN